MPTSDYDYLSRRAAQERSAAERASCTQTRGIHLDLASRYAERLASIEREAAVRNVVPIRPASA